MRGKSLGRWSGGWQVAGGWSRGHNGHINHRTVLQTSVKTLLLSCNKARVLKMIWHWNIYMWHLIFEVHPNFGFQKEPLTSKRFMCENLKLWNSWIWHLPCSKWHPSPVLTLDARHYHPLKCWNMWNLNLHSWACFVFIFWGWEKRELILRHANLPRLMIGFHWFTCFKRAALCWYIQISQ